ncbi:MAG: hypothetical protein AAGD14_08720, partial [Planctomycetota bacterium]
MSLRWLLFPALLVAGVACWLLLDDDDGRARRLDRVAEGRVVERVESAPPAEEEPASGVPPGTHKPPPKDPVPR